MRSRLLFGVVSAALLAVSAQAAAPPPVTRITIPGMDVFPESITSTAAGDIIVSSTKDGAIYRAPAGADTAVLWIDPKVSGLKGALGVYADERTDTLYVCSQSIGAAPEVAAAHAALVTFNLKTGAPMARFPMPDAQGAFCNDIATAPNGTAYVADTRLGRVLRLAPGGFGLEVWLKDPRLEGVDGLDVAADGGLYVNTVGTGKLFKIGIRPDGTPGDLNELAVSLELKGPDGMRHGANNRFVLAEGGAGRVSEVVMDGGRATVLPLVENAPGVTSATFTRGRIWYADAKFRFRREGKSPEPFTIESTAPAQR